MERANGFEPSTPTLARLCSTTELRPHINNMYKDGLLKWSGRRDSNPRQPAWKAGTLATELRPHLCICIVVPRVGFEPTRPKAEDFESTKSTSSITEAHTFET